MELAVGNDMDNTRVDFLVLHTSSVVIPQAQISHALVYLPTWISGAIHRKLALGLLLCVIGLSSIRFATPKSASNAWPSSEMRMLLCG